MDDPALDEWWPPHAYIPGQTPRHSETLFDPLKGTVGTRPWEQVNETVAWRAGMRFLRGGFFWEAHEVMEPVWMACPPNSPEKLMVQAIIQWANAGLKETMGRAEAAKRLRAMSSQLFREAFMRGEERIFGRTLAEVRDEMPNREVRPTNLF